jgi:hypothetical protein
MDVDGEPGMDVDGEPGMDVDGEPGMEKQNPYAPFTSELDWRIARWTVKDNPGHKVFDRLLSIPGVSLVLQMNIHWVQETIFFKKIM